MINRIFKDLFQKIMDHGYEYEDPNRVGVIRKQLSQYTFDIDFRDGFPALALRHIPVNAGIRELSVFLSGSTDIRDLWSAGIFFWEKDYANYLKSKYDIRINYTLNQVVSARKQFLEGNSDYDQTLRTVFYTKPDPEDNIYDLGKIYPHGMRKYGGSTDQIANLVHTLKTNPMATKKTVVMYNPSENNEKALTECHWAFEALVEPLSSDDRIELATSIPGFGEVAIKELEEWLDAKKVPKYGLRIKWHQHSVDVYLGLPTNVIYYSVLCEFLAERAGMYAMGVTASLSNVHLYDNAFEEVKELLTKEVPEGNNPELVLNKAATQDLDWAIKSLIGSKIEGYVPCDKLNVEMLAYSK